jgi:hypothetical protein
MPKYVIEREIPNAGQMTDEELRLAARQSMEALENLGPKIQWLHSWVTDNKVYCLYIAPDEETVCEHARLASLPADRVSAVRRMLDPSAAD